MNLSDLLTSANGGLNTILNHSVSDATSSIELLRRVTKDFTVPYDSLSEDMKLLATRAVSAINNARGTLKMAGLAELGGAWQSLAPEAHKYVNETINKWNDTLEQSADVRALSESLEAQAA